ncbi:hypothetical protein HanPI659440_Chr12g0477801 [Helianthus annuus]|nr:hypothetical protein HanPI659440_Chr12g0477801 [Helianthus annuus]
MLAVFRKEKCEMIQFTHYRANDKRRKRRAKMEGPHGCNLKGKKRNKKGRLEKQPQFMGRCII